MKKKILAILMATAMSIAMVACNSGKQTNTQESSVESSSAEESTVAESTENGEEQSAEGVMTYAEYAAAEFDSPVVIEAYVQANQSWWDGKITVYTQDKDGAYFLYEMKCDSQEEADKLVPGTKIRVSGFKSQWSGEIEIIDATYEIIEGDTYVASPVDVTELLGKEELVEKQNQRVAFKGMTVEKEALYKWDGSGKEGDDLYFDVSVNGATYTFTVESYLCGADTEVYKAVKALKIGDVVDMEGFLYWYEGANPHITAVTVR